MWTETADSGEDGVRGFGPDERLGVAVGLGNEVVDGDLKLDDRGEDAALGRHVAVEHLVEEVHSRLPNVSGP